MTDKESLGDFSRLPFRKRIELTKESIQKDLEASDYLFPKNVYINTKYILEIIEQAERVQELESELSKYETRINNLTFDLAVNRVQNKRYREILTYVREIDCIDWNKEELAEMARKALEGEE